MDTAAKNPKVYEAICKVASALSREGIAKTGKNQQQNYSFRGIDQIYNALAPLLAQNRLCILPRVIERSIIERVTQKGGTLFYTVIKMEFDFVSAEDGSVHTVATIGEAMDSGDKSSNKAQSAAYKYAAMMTFCIPTEGDNDTENQTHEVKSESPSERMARAIAEFENRLNASTSLVQITSITASNNKLLLAVRNKNPKEFDRLSLLINQHTEAFHLSEGKTQ